MKAGRESNLHLKFKRLPVSADEFYVLYQKPIVAVSGIGPVYLLLYKPEGGMPEDKKSTENQCFFILDAERTGKISNLLVAILFPQELTSNATLLKFCTIVV
jgi:hypothetical protein